MHIYLDCYSCFIRQALHAARMAGADENQQHYILQEVLKSLQALDMGTSPPVMGYRVHTLVQKIAANSDPYQSIKDRSTQDSLKLLPQMRKLVAESVDPLEIAIRLSIAGNIIDYGPQDVIDDLWETVQRVLTSPLSINDIERLRRKIAEVSWILYLADNAGETVFDRVLIETLGIPTIYAVKGGPILNDATERDAVAAGIHQCATIISNGAAAMGTILDLCSESFQAIYRQAPLIIAKGQANYETLSNAGSHVFSLLQIKCPVIGKDMGAAVGSLIVRSCVSK